MESLLKLEGIIKLHLSLSRNHISVIVGKFMVVIGGINQLGHYLSDISMLNLETLKW